MSALPRPDLPPGAHRELVDALHDLHHRAGWPSLRVLAAEAGCSHTTVSHAFSAPRLPSWGTLEVLVDALHGDTTHFHELWLAASTPTDGSGSSRPRIAGRRSELAAVRRHLESGTGLMLVTGEAGIGKTKLVTTAAEQADWFVATGHCLPLSIQDPLMPFIEVFHAVHAVDDGQLLGAALTAGHPHVRESLARLLPELADDTAVAAFDNSVRQQVFAAVGRCLTQLHELRGVSVVFEDVHWADAATLDLLELLVTRGHRPPLLATWRTEDVDVSARHREWLMRMQRLASTSRDELGPLTAAETNEQLSLRTGSPIGPELAARIHHRSGGHPLFTEQLAVTSEIGEPLPRLLNDLLDRRLDGLAGDATAVATTLGVADRDLPDDVLDAVTGLDHGRLLTALQELSARHLLATDGARTARLRHPLLAEAARRRLVPGEATHVHARLAQALALRPDANAAEVAEHWREAGDAEQELPWRVRAAHVAAERDAAGQEADHWLRALDIWPEHPDGPQALSRADTVLAATHALDRAGREVAGRALALSELESGQVIDRATRFDLAIRVAAITWGQEGPEQALQRLDEAESLHGEGLSPDRKVRALRLRSALLSKSGHNEEAVRLLDVAHGLSDRVTDPDTLVHLHASRGWHLGHAGDLSGALESLDRARRILRDSPAAGRELFTSMMHTDVLLRHARPPAEVAAAAEKALELIAHLDLRSSMANMVRSNVALAWLGAGQPARAVDLMLDEALTSDEFSMWPLRLIAGWVHVTGARLEDALERLGQQRQGDDFAALDFAVPTSEALLWLGRAPRAQALLNDLLEGMLGSGTVSIAGPAFVMLARATADAHAHGPPAQPGHLLGLLHKASTDPLGPGPGSGVRPACAAQWSAELARGSRADTVPQWTRAAAESDALDRPHDAAYCRWRAAQVALREGHGTVAARLLKRAASDAREHVPLSQAIARTSASA